MIIYELNTGCHEVWLSMIVIAPPGLTLIHATTYYVYVFVIEDWSRSIPWWFKDNNLSYRDYV